MSDTDKIAVRDAGESIDKIARENVETDPMQREINGCRVIMHFLHQPSDGVMERVRSILSNAYEERVQNDLRELVSPKVS